MPLSDGLDTRPCKIVDPHLDTETAVCRVEYAETETKFTLWSYHVLYIQHSEIVSDCKPNLCFYCNFVECSEKNLHACELQSSLFQNCSLHSKI